MFSRHASMAVFGSAHCPEDRAVRAFGGSWQRQPARPLNGALHESIPVHFMFWRSGFSIICAVCNSQLWTIPNPRPVSTVLTRLSGLTDAWAGAWLCPWRSFANSLAGDPEREKGYAGSARMFFHGSRSAMRWLSLVFAAYILFA